MGTQVRGATNSNAKRDLGWTLRYPSWRRGFPAIYSAIRVADRRAADRGSGPTRTRD